MQIKEVRQEPERPFPLEKIIIELDRREVSGIKHNVIIDDDANETVHVSSIAATELLKAIKRVKL